MPWGLRLAAMQAVVMEAIARLGLPIRPRRPVIWRPRRPSIDELQALERRRRSGPT